MGSTAITRPIWSDCSNPIWDQVAPALSSDKYHFKIRSIRSTSISFPGSYINALELDGNGQIADRWFWNFIKMGVHDAPASVVLKTLRSQSYIKDVITIGWNSHIGNPSAGIRGSNKFPFATCGLVARNFWWLQFEWLLFVGPPCW